MLHLHHLKFSYQQSDRRSCCQCRILPFYLRTQKSKVMTKNPARNTRLKLNMWLYLCVSVYTPHLQGWKTPGDKTEKWRNRD